ncbi:energy transducer TonB [Acinetobacter qingfengensis]|uniref:TonB C-terminal domain-containing protein n=1 Tax=Acinetobacter qingfengensis TaxID=1262585 RepID=A0A1E7R3G7_9GAMM|nr:energy transducer TonB [Acinetobacter qingfengensis]KAA8735385.1 energy transducer TonB [Acinetobacter qingfengensis]OEY93898.1 hypothetical protein BJI46_13810 [Acinetobacter qingfengensis]
MNESEHHLYKRAILSSQLRSANTVAATVFSDPFPGHENFGTLQGNGSKKTKYVVIAVAAVAVLHYAVWEISKHLPTQPLPEKPSEPVVVEIIKPKEEPPKIPPVTQQPKIPPVSQKPKTVDKPAEQPKPVVKAVTPQPTKAVQQPTPQPVVQPTPVATEKTIPTPAPTPAPVQQPKEAPKQENEPVTEARGFAGYLSNPTPDYPEVALDRGWEGSVMLRVKVAANGSPLSVSIKQGSGKKVLDDAAIRTVKRWKFSPAKRGSTPIEGWVDVPINFKLPKN